MEPERPIEKRLKAYAEQRCREAGEPLELSADSRRTLLNEAVKRAAPESGGNWFSRLVAGVTLSWPRKLAAAAVVLCALGLLGFTLIRSLGPNESEHLGNLSTPGGLSARRTIAMPPATAADSLPPESPPSSSAPPPGPVVTEVVFPARPTQKFIRTKTAPVSGGTQLTRDTDSVLTSFEAIKDKDELRIRDQDGSLYTGVWPTGGAATATQLQRTANVSAAAWPATQGVPGNYWFTVVGTNKTLGQPVIFRGAFSPSPNANPAGPDRTTLSPAVLTPPSAPGATPSDAWIYGSVKVGSGNEIRIQAAPVNR
jgi:hypothetical protein